MSKAPSLKSISHGVEKTFEWFQDQAEQSVRRGRATQQVGAEVRKAVRNVADWALTETGKSIQQGELSPGFKKAVEVAKKFGESFIELNKKNRASESGSNNLGSVWKYCGTMPTSKFQKHLPSPRIIELDLDRWESAASSFLNPVAKAVDLKVYQGDFDLDGMPSDYAFVLGGTVLFDCQANDDHVMEAFYQMATSRWKNFLKRNKQDREKNKIEN